MDVCCTCVICVSTQPYLDIAGKLSTSYLVVFTTFRHHFQKVYPERTMPNCVDFITITLWHSRIVCVVDGDLTSALGYNV